MKTNKQKGGMLPSTSYVEESMLLRNRELACFFSGVAVEETCHPLKNFVRLQVENDITVRCDPKNPHGYRIPAFLHQKNAHKKNRGGLRGFQNDANASI
jgi:hypothetical protein